MLIYPTIKMSPLLGLQGLGGGLGYLAPKGAADTSSSSSTSFPGAVSFDGTGDYLTVADGATDFSFGTGDFTIEYFLYATSFPGLEVMVDFRKTSSSDVSPVIYLM